MNTVPGLTTRLKFTPEISTEEMRDIKEDKKFNYVLLCNKICGGAHYKMKMIVVVLEESDYNKWMKVKMTKTFTDGYFPAPAPAAPADAPADENPADTSNAIVANEPVMNVEA